MSQQLGAASSASAHSSIGVLHSNASYCAADDAACSRCARTWREDTARGASIALNATCVGATGCVCVAACELPSWQARVLDAAQCTGTDIGSSSTNTSATLPSPSPASVNGAASDAPSVTQLLVAGAICMAAVLLFALISLGLGKLVRKIDTNAQASRRERFLNAFRLPVRVPTGPQLQLEGWTAMHQKLVQDGAGASTGAPTLAPPLTLTPEYVQMAGSTEQDQRELWIRW